MAEKTTLADLTKRKKANREVVPVCLDPILGSKYQKALEQVAMAEAEKTAFPENDKLQAELVERLEKLNKEAKTLETKVKKEMYDFVLESINPTTLDKILTSHPPTQEQLAEAKKQGLEIQFNSETFAPSLVAACLVDPESSEEEVIEMWSSDSWNGAELNELFQAAMRVSNSRPNLNLKKD